MKYLFFIFFIWITSSSTYRYDFNYGWCYGDTAFRSQLTTCYAGYSGYACSSGCGVYCPTGFTQITKILCQALWYDRVCERSSAAKAETGAKDNHDYEVYARANFGAYGEAKIDENGNIIISLDFSDDKVYDICQFDDDKSASFLYYIYDKWNNDESDLLYSEQCNDVVGRHFNPFSKPLCSEIDDEPNYYNCEMGDLSGRFQAAYLNSNGKIMIEENLSYSKGKEGFCAARLTPENLFEKSIAFHCNNEDQEMLFCAPFSIFVEDNY